MTSRPNRWQHRLTGASTTDSTTRARPRMQRRTLSALLAGFAATAMFASTGAATGTVMYDSVPDPLPPTVSSLGYASELEYGQVITPATTGPLASVTVTMVSRACQHEGQYLWDCRSWPTADGSLPTYNHPITVNLYELGAQERGEPAGALIGSMTRTVAVPYRPSADSRCGNGDWWAVGDQGHSPCVSSYAFNVTFDFSDAGVTLPEAFVVGVAYDNGRNSLLGPGPYDKLSVGWHHWFEDRTPEVGERGALYVKYYDQWGTTQLVFQGGDGTQGPMIRFEAAPSGPVTADDCKTGGFANYGFTNQGQCVSSVNASEHAGK